MLRLKTWKCLSVVASKASSSESTASSVNCVTVNDNNDTDVSIPARKITESSTLHVHVHA